MARARSISSIDMELTKLEAELAKIHEGQTVCCFLSGMQTGERLRIHKPCQFRNFQNILYLFLPDKPEI